MRTAANVTTDVPDQDAGLVEWFLSLTPAQRLAELDSRVSFFLAMRKAHEQLQPNPGGRDPASR